MHRLLNKVCNVVEAATLRIVGVLVIYIMLIIGTAIICEHVLKIKPPWATQSWR